MKNQKPESGLLFILAVIVGLFFNTQIPESNAAETSFSDITPADLNGKSNFILPFHLVNGFILIEGQVVGQKGKFMFDTGTPFSFFLNNNFLSLEKNVYFGEGKTGSGQALTLYIQDSIKHVQLSNQIKFEQLNTIPHADFSFLEKGLVADYLGFIGHGFNKNYLFVIDYDTQNISFHPVQQDSKTFDDNFDKDSIIVTLHFTSKEDGRMPEVEFSMGDEKITGKFDTGSQGWLKLTERMKAQLEDAGYLSIDKMDYLYGTYEPYQSCTLKGLRYGNQAFADIHNLKLEISENNEIGLGYQFLKQYVTAWNYADKTILLLKK